MATYTPCVNIPKISTIFLGYVSELIRRRLQPILDIYDVKDRSFKMINIDFSLAISLYILIFLIIILIAWLVNKKQKDKDLNVDDRFIWHCCVCTYTYINTKEDMISVCPRCGSYNKKLSKATT